MKDLVGAFQADTKGVVKQEFTSYRKRDGMLVKETTQKILADGTDWHDVSSSQPLVEVKDD